ncbi:MAG: TIGR03960 family B12-binding radical SAM protein [Bacillota bacterium]|nr:TIGR03960 family B12-binding radical SAM protein [Bacillota bacterium]
MHRSQLQQLLNTSVFPYVERPGQYGGGEYNAIVKDAAQLDCRMLFAFPDSYEIGMSHLGLRVLYEAVNRQPRLAMERAFMPLTDMIGKMREYRLPLFSWESRSPAAEFDVIGFTLQYELSYTNVLAMLDLAGLPLLAAERGGGQPLVIAGGPCACNPEPLADFIDLFLIGEAEQSLIELLRLCAEAKAEGIGRGQLLARAAAIGGCYVPNLYTPHYDAGGRFSSLTAQDGAPPRVQKRVIAAIDEAPFPRQPLLPQVKAVHDRAVVEVMRGCTHGCRFCQAGIIYRPLREKSEPLLLQQAADNINCSGYEDISLLSLSSADYSRIDSLIDQLHAAHGARGVGVTLPSLRVDAFSVGLAARTQQVRKSGITLAPEAGSERMRAVINKGVSEQDILSAAAAAFSQGYSTIKLYFMIGLPFEQDEDIAAIAGLCRQIVAAARAWRPPGARKPLKITLGVASFVPKAHTPFQYAGGCGAEQLQHKQQLLLELLKPLRQVTVNFHDIAASLLEAAFARGDRRLGAVLLRAYRAGCIFDGWSEHFRAELWRSAFAGEGLSIEQYAAAEYQADSPLAWRHIDCGIDEGWLYREYQRARAAQLTADCRHGECSGCGVCPALGVETRLAAAAAAPPPPRQAVKPAAAVSRWRCRLSIQGDMAWLSHLDLLAALEKGLRRSGLPVAFTQGFNPHIQLSWGPAHPVGLRGDAEYVDIYFAAEPPDGWWRTLDSLLPAGLRLLNAVAVDRGLPSLMAEINYAIYRIKLAVPLTAEIEQAVQKLRQEPELLIERDSPKGKRSIDMMQSLVGLTVTGDSIIAHLRLDRGAAPRPQEIAAIIAPLAQIEYTERQGLFIEKDGQLIEPCPLA